MWKKIIIILVILGVLAGGFFYYKNRNTAKTASEKVTAVKMIEVSPQTIRTSVMADGTVVADEETEVKVQLNGLVRATYVETGDSIKKGDRILELDAEDLRNNLDDAQLNLSEARKNYQDILDKYNKQDEYNNLKLKEAKSSLEIARLSFEKEKIRLEERRQDLLASLHQARTDLQKAKTELEKYKYLYKSGAIPQKKLEEAEEKYQQARDDYQQLKKQLKTLEEKTIPNSLELARLEVSNARDKLELLKVTLEQDEITENDLELARIKVKRVENQIDDLKQQLNKIMVRSPVNGTIVGYDVERGDKLVEGATVCKVADISQLKIEAMVDEIDVNEVQVGQKVKITSDSFKPELEGQVHSIAPVAVKEGNINKFKTRIMIKETGGVLRPGMFVNTEITTNHRKSVITVPPLAVMGQNEKYLYVATEGKVEKRPVIVGLKNLTKVEVRGVEAGEKVVVGPFTVLRKLKPGMPVVDIQTKKGEIQKQ